MTTLDIEPLEYRPIRSLGVEEYRGWKLKLYTITELDKELAEAIMPAVRRVLQVLESAPPDDSTGFVVVHQGSDAVWLLVDLWQGDILHQTTFRSDLGRPPEFTAIPPGGPTACVWELPVLAHERDAYVAHMLQPRPPQPHRYLADVVPQAKPSTNAAPEQGNGSGGGPSWNDAEQLIKTAERAFSQADVPAILELFDDDVVVRYAGLPEMRGCDALADLLHARFERQRDYRVEKTLRAVSGDVIVDSWTGEWTDAHTGQQMAGSGMEFLRVYNGKVCELEAVFHGWEVGDIQAHTQIV